MAITTTSNINAGVNTYFDKLFLRTLGETLRVSGLGQKRVLPKGEGNTIEFFQWNKIEVGITSGEVDALIGTEGVNPSATTVTGISKTKSLKEYGLFSKHTRLVKATHIDMGLKGVVELWGKNAGENIEVITMQEVSSNGAMPVRADGDATYSFSGTFTGTPTTIELVDSDLTANTGFGDANDDLNQSVIYITTGIAKGIATTVTDYVAASGTMTIPTIDQAPAAGDAFTVVGPNGLSSNTASNADSVNTDSINVGMELLKTFDATAMDSDGFFAGVLSPEAERGLMQDTNWTNLSEHSASTASGEGMGGLIKGEIGKWGGVRWFRSTVPFKFPVEADGTAGTGGGPGAEGANYIASQTYAVGAGITVTYIFGKDAFGTIDFDGFKKVKGSKSMPKIIVKIPGKGDTSEPLNLNSTVGWYAAYATKALLPLNAVQIWSAEPQVR